MSVLLLMLLSFPIFSLVSAVYFRDKSFMLYFFLPNFVLMIMSMLTAFLPSGMMGFVGIISLLPAIFLYILSCIIFAAGNYFFNKKLYWLAVLPVLSFLPFFYFIVKFLIYTLSDNF